ncbi:MAG: non-ribosomal peptide synthetase, partial [Deltaproteobacteria bacterium]|nr:non-ribosomal peptide synthetase [Deltaproteobacteria bacterium]
AALARLTRRRRRGKDREGEKRTTAPAAIPRRPAAAPAELSFAQQRLWFLDRFEPATAIYNIPAGVHLSGRLEVVALGRSLDEIVRRHQVLRTTFGSRDGRPEPVLGPPRRLTMPLVDLRRLSADARRHEAQRLTGEEARRPFDLVRGPLLRVTLLELEAGAPERAEHLLLLTVHHIVSDAWSMAVFVDELGALYRAFAAGQASPLPALPIQYADFAHWQRRQLRGEVLE